MRVKHIAVKRLFGLFNHDIPLQSSERVTILHGPNGFGKTVILRMIAALVQGKLDIFEHTPFEEFSLTLDDGSSRIIRRAIERSSQKPPQIKLSFFVRDIHGGLVAVESSTPPNV